MSSLRGILLAICPVVSAVLLASCQSAPPKNTYIPTPPPVPRTPPPPRTDIVPGDELEVFVLEDSSFNGSFKVREGGDIIMQKLGRVKVGNMSVSSAQEVIRKRIETSQIANPTVIVDRVSKVAEAQKEAEKARLLVYVTGQVSRPGQHMITMTGTQPITAYEALLIAGGTTEFADERRAYILRRDLIGNRKNIPLDIRAIRLGQGSDVAIQEGDLITVPERRFGLGF
jgi:protein involved in polysaccharide export with SLBB domain